MLFTKGGNTQKKGKFGGKINLNFGQLKYRESEYGDVSWKLEIQNVQLQEYKIKIRIIITVLSTLSFWNSDKTTERMFQRVTAIDIFKKKKKKKGHAPKHAE